MSSERYTHTQEQLEELRQLNLRFNKFFNHQREANSSRPQSSALLHGSQILESELTRIKRRFENELDKTKVELHEAQGERESLSGQRDRGLMLAGELKDRYFGETLRTAALNEEVQKLQEVVAGKERDLMNAEKQQRDSTTELNKLRKDLDHVSRENHDLRRKLNREECLVEKMADEVQQLKTKMKLQEDIANEEISGVTDRLETASQSILTLESKVRELTRPDNSLNELLVRVKKSAEEELARYQHEAEGVYQKNLADLKIQIEENFHRIGCLADDNRVLKELLNTAEGRQSSMETELGLLRKQKEHLTQSLTRERTTSADTISALERRLHMLNDVLYRKMQEATPDSGRETNLVKMEIDRLKALLQHAETNQKMSGNVTPSGRASRVSNNDECASELDELRESAGSGVHVVMETAQNWHEEPVRESSHVVGGMTVQQASPLPSSNHHGVYEVEDDRQIAENPFDRNKFHAKSQRVKSAPSGRTGARLVSSTQGKGTQYYTEMMSDLKTARPKSSFHSTDELVGFTAHFRMAEVAASGRYVRIFNEANNEEDLSGFCLKQNLAGQGTTFYRFPQRLMAKPKTCVTVWAGCNDQTRDAPPTHFWTDQPHIWETNGTVVTLLCRPTGQAVAWASGTGVFCEEALASGAMRVEEEKLLSTYEQNFNGIPQTPPLLKREKAAVRLPDRSPMVENPQIVGHPHSAPHRQALLGNDNSSWARQTRTQRNPRPDPVPGQPYCGAPAQTMGSAALTGFKPSPPELQSGVKVSADFLPTSRQTSTIIGNMQAGQNNTYNPPLPRAY